MSKSCKAMFIGIFMTSLGIISAYATVPWWTVEKVSATVTSSERVDGEWMIFTGSEVFKNHDSWHWFKFNSSDLQAKAIVGHTYKFKVYGWRVPFLSWYRNVIKISEEK